METVTFVTLLVLIPTLIYAAFRVGWHYGRISGKADHRWHVWHYQQELNRRTRI